MVKSKGMNRPLCWICSIVGAAIALMVFAAYSKPSKPVYAANQELTAPAHVYLIDA